MNDDFLRPYKKLQAVEEQQEQQWLLDIYSNCYKNKFKGEPIFPIDNSHITMMKDLRRQCGAKLAELLQHFFEMQDEWYLKKGYSLSCFKDHLPAINLSYSKKRGAHQLKDKICIEYYCEACWTKMPLTIPNNFDFNKVIKCEECTKKNVPVKTVSKEERKNVIYKLGATFK